MEPGNNIVLTGVPRSGTTLACFLLSKIPNVVALNEPMRTAKYPTARAALEAVPQFYTATRTSILQRGRATVRGVKGKMTDNHFAQVKGKRTKLVSKQEIAIEKPLHPDFTLACKHNALFTLLQDELNDRYPYFALVRNPLSVLASWNSLDIPASRGEIPALDKLNPALGRQLKASGDRYARQLFILDWYFRRYAELRPEQVIRYEEMVASNGQSLSVVHDGARNLTEELSSYNRSKVYDWEKIEPVAERLLAATQNACWQFYTPASVESLLQST